MAETIKKQASASRKSTAKAATKPAAKAAPKTATKAVAKTAAKSKPKTTAKADAPKAVRPVRKPKAAPAPTAAPAPAPVSAPAPVAQAPVTPPPAPAAPVRRFVKPNWQNRTPAAAPGTLPPVPPAASAPPPPRPAAPAQAPRPAAAPAPRPQQAPPARPPQAQAARPPQAPHQRPPQSQPQSHPQHAAPAPRPAPPPAPPEPPEPLEYASGIVEFGRKEFSEARLRQLDTTYVSNATDPVIGTHLIEKYKLRPGLMVKLTLGKPFGGGHQPGQNFGKHAAKGVKVDPAARRVKDIVEIEGRPPEEWMKVKDFQEKTIIMPEPRLSLEHPGCAPACRFIDLFCPIGYGTRGMIVSPPKAGKTTLLQQIATAIHRNHPEVKVFALLVDERPEEVTDFRRNCPVTVWASSNDHPPERHVGLAIAALERCKRLVEMGHDVVVLLDSLTRLGRAFNVAPNVAGIGRTLSGGLDAGALAIPKQLFGAARKCEDGGSLTIIATALVHTGSRGDEVIFEEFKGTGNMELILDRRIAEQRIFPAMDLAASGTRNEHKLMSRHELETVTALRRRLMSMTPPQQVEQLLKACERYPTNANLVGAKDSPAQA